MTADRFARLFREGVDGRGVSGGVYQLRGRVTVGAIAQQAARAGWRCFYLRGWRINDKATFLAECAEAMRFPGYFGHNWDALEECLTDLAWAPARGYVTVYEDAAPFAQQHPQDWRIALAILRDSAAAWQARGVPFVVLLRRGGRAAVGLPSL